MHIIHLEATSATILECYIVYASAHRHDTSIAIICIIHFYFHFYQFIKWTFIQYIIDFILLSIMLLLSVTYQQFCTLHYCNMKKGKKNKNKTYNITKV